MDNFAIYMESASVNFRNEDTVVNFKNRFDGSLPHYGLFHKTMNYLKSIGFTVGKDPRIEKEYKCLSKDHRYGRKGDLEFKGHRYPAGFKIEFFQNVVFENPHGGEYDFDKYTKMPYRIKLQFRLTCNKIRTFLLFLGYEDESKPELKMSEEKIKFDFVDSCHHAPKDMGFNLSDYDGFTRTTGDKCGYEYKDRDKKVLRNGEIKYFRGRDGYLRRGKIYHRLNMMFWVILNETDTTIMADHELFDLTDDEVRGRKAKPKVPASYVQKCKTLENASVKELRAELKRRGVA